MSMTKIAGVLTLSAFTVLGAFACSSSSDSGSSPGGCTGSGSSTNAACGSCVQSKCSSQYNACFGSGGQCSAFVNAGCKGIPDSTCLACTNPLTECQKTNCATECKTSGGTDAGGTDTGGGTDAGPTPTPATAECKTLLTCCDAATFPASTKGTCYYVAGADDTKNCTDGYNGFKALGYCP